MKDSEIMIDVMIEDLVKKYEFKEDSKLLFTTSKTKLDIQKIAAMVQRKLREKLVALTGEQKWNEGLQAAAFPFGEKGRVLQEYCGAKVAFLVEKSYSSRQKDVTAMIESFHSVGVQNIEMILV